MSKMVLVCGMSGSGKTTFAQDYAIKNKLKYYNPDDYYADYNGDECCRDNFFEVWMNLWRDIHDSEMSNEDILVDTNSLTVAQRTQFLEWFPSFKHEMIWMYARKTRCFWNNKHRKRVIPDEAMEKLWDKLEPPSKFEEKDWNIKVCVNVNNEFSQLYDFDEFNNMYFMMCPNEHFPLETE